MVLYTQHGFRGIGKPSGLKSMKARNELELKNSFH